MNDQLLCQTCRVMKPQDDFHNDWGRKNRDFKAGVCKVCAAARHQKKRRSKVSYHDPRRVAAKNEVTKAVMNGSLYKWPCCAVPDCTSEKRIEGHHADYDQPLLVTWLCADHHFQIHREARQAPRTSARAQTENIFWRALMNVRIPPASRQEVMSEYKRLLALPTLKDETSGKESP